MKRGKFIKLTYPIRKSSQLILKNKLHTVVAVSNHFLEFRLSRFEQSVTPRAYTGSRLRLGILIDPRHTWWKCHYPFSLCPMVIHRSIKLRHGHGCNGQLEKWIKHCLTRNLNIYYLWRNISYMEEFVIHKKTPTKNSVQTVACNTPNLFAMWSYFQSF